jgi:hypothetical protein
VQRAAAVDEDEVLLGEDAVCAASVRERGVRWAEDVSICYSAPAMYLRPKSVSA